MRRTGRTKRGECPHRVGFLAVLLAATLGLGACTDEDGVAPNAGRRISALHSSSPVPSPCLTPAEEDASPTPTPAARPDPTPSPASLAGQTETSSPDPEATPAPTPSPRATATPTSVQAVIVSPGQATINLPAVDAAQEAGLPTRVQLSALVRSSNQTVTTSVTWSAASELVSVSSQGLVTARATGTVVVTATSIQDPSKRGSAVITVEDNGSLDLVID